MNQTHSTPTPSDAAMSPEEVNAFIQAIASNPDAQILLTQDGQGKMLKMAALIRLCGEVAKQATPLREENDKLRAALENMLWEFGCETRNPMGEKRHDAVAVIEQARAARAALAPERKEMS